MVAIIEYRLVAIIEYRLLTIFLVYFSSPFRNQSVSNGVSFGASVAKSLYVGLSSFNNFLRSMGEERNAEREGGLPTVVSGEGVAQVEGGLPTLVRGEAVAKVGHSIIAFQCIISMHHWPLGLVFN